MGSTGYDGDDVVIKVLPDKDAAKKDAKGVTGEVDGTKRCAHVHVCNTDDLPGGSNSPTRPTLPNARHIANSTGLYLTGTYQKIEFKEVPGYFAYCALEFSTNAVSVKLEIDGNLIWEFDELADLLDVLNAGPHPAARMEFTFDNGGPKTFVYSPDELDPVGTKWELWAKSSSGGNPRYVMGVVRYSDDS